MAKRRKSAPIAKKEVTKVVMRYDGAANGRRMGNWQAPTSGPNRALTGLQTLRNRSRDAVRNEWQSGKAVNVRVSSLIGTGIVPRPDTKNETQKARINALWNEFVDAADADGLLDYYGMQALAARCIDEGGEVFIRARPRRLNSGFGVPVQFQLLEPEMVPLFDADAWPGLPPGNRIRSGVEFNRMGQRVAYWVYKAHPSDETSFNAQDLLRITVEFMKHVFKPLRIGQIRGVPADAPNLAKLRTVTSFDDAALARQHTANLFTGFVTKAVPTADGIDPVTGRAVEFDADGMPLASLEPGTMQELLPGEDVKFANPPGAGADYPDFMRWQMMGLSAGRNVPYELLTGDLKDVSDRALRIILNEFHRACEQEQWHIIIPGICKWVYSQWAKYAYLAGSLSATDANVPVIWAPDAWKYVHPVQDVQSKQLEMEMGIKSRSQIISEQGDDPQQVDAERAADLEREESLGLKMPPPDPNAQPPVDPAQEAQANKANAEARLLAAKADRETLEAAATAARLRAESNRLQAEAALFAAQATSAEAEVRAIDARAAREHAEAEARLAELSAADARASAESAARIAALEEAARLAREDAEAKAEAQSRAELFAKEQREIALRAEKDRAAVAALEREAAELALAELK